MTKPENPMAEQDALRREAYDWVMRLTSGDATAADAEALHRWRQTSQAHRQAFAEANLLWDKLRPAAVESVSRVGVSVQAAEFRDARRAMGRRAFLGGALTAAAASIGYAVVRPPLDLWPSLTEMTADYRTGIGQQQQIAFDDSVSVKLNTRTSIAVLSPDSRDGQADRIELVAGEAAITRTPHSVKPFVVVAAQGQTIAQAARFNVRNDVSSVCVTCLEGDLRVEHLGQTATARSRQQIVYTASNLGAAVDVDPEAVTAWERGLLVFRNDPLARVIEEVNRYRAGKIILMRAELGRRPVLATFRIDRIDEVVPRLQAVFGVEVTTLPGGIVLVS
ncbi:MAG: FecR domain-containing protein [Tardiphaga sp.]